MARRVVISTMGGGMPTAPTAADGEALVENMISFWQGKLSRVLPDKPDLIVLPEMCDLFAGQSNAEVLDYYRYRGDRLLDFFSDVACRHRCYIAYAAVRQVSDGTWRNSVQMIDRQGGIAGIYDKNHLFLPEADTGCHCGSEAPLIECDFGTVACAICFDLNFDELRLKYVAAKPDLILFPSMYHGGLMQAYWAYSCRAYFVSACRSCSAGPVGVLPSGIVSPIGTSIGSSTPYRDYITATVNLDYCLAHINFNGEKLDALKAKYGRDVTIVDPDGHLGPLLLTSESAAVSMSEMVREFEIELLDDFFERALAFHHADRAASLSIADEPSRDGMTREVGVDASTTRASFRHTACA